MRLHRITLRDVRGVTERTVHFPDSGVVVVEGPNEIGKSTLLEAFDRLLDLKATSRSARAQALQPIGRDVAPFVEAEFSLAGQRVRLAKQWLRSPRTELEILGQRPEQLTGAAAQARLEELTAALDTTLWEALRLAQSDDGTLVPLMSSGVLQEALDAAADAHLHDGDGEQVLDLVEDEYLRYFTSRTARPTGDYRAAIEAWTAAQEDVAEAHRRMVEAEDLLTRQAQAQADVQHRTEELAVAEAELRGARERSQAVAELVAGHQRATERCDAARSMARAAAHAQQARRRQVDSLTRLGATVAEHEQEVTTLERQAERVADSLREAEAGLVASEAAVEQAEDDLEQARRRRSLAEATDELASLERAVAEVAGRVETLTRARAAMPEVPVSETRRREVERLRQELAVLEARHESASAAVLVESLGAPVEIGAVDSDGSPAPDPSPDAAHPTPGRSGRGSAATLAPGESRQVAATDDLEIVVPGAARVVVRSAEAGERRAAVAAARSALADTVADLGCRDADEVEQRAASTAAAQRALEEAERDLAAVLAAHDLAPLTGAVAATVPAALTDRRDGLRARVEALAADLPPAADPAPEGAQVAEDERVAAALVRTRREARRAASAELATAGRQAREVTTALDRLAGQLDGERARAEQEQELLDQQRAQLPDSELDDRATEHEAALAEAQARAAQARQAMSDADVEGLAAQVRAHEAALARLRSERERARDHLHALTGQVELAASEGRRELYELAEAGLDEAERRLAAVDRRARAVRHLRGALHEHRDSAHRAYVRPFTDVLERLGRRVYGDSFAVTVDQRLSVQARTLHGTTVPFDELSGGAKEQLGILARIAVAHLVDPTQGVPVVIDDALGYSDPQRLEQMGGIFAGGAGADPRDVQVILLTCTPDRYASIPDAQTVRLEAS
ncbi:AAA family ATPase [Serinicoccus kebangsaanensis]|uniref:AAA family ATPase n=1 Tax=Serinicoccus kebangsaanensis TaxID=2602069 RepID=UPI00124D4BBD|nr:AAA family ATPase [Serinicoccus kebangsaanensis]